MKSRLTRCAFLSGCICLSCLLAPGSVLARTVTDMVGRTVTVPEKAHRLVTTFKPASLCVTSLGLQDKLVAIDTDSKKDPMQLAVEPAIADLPAIGQKSTGLNFEAILSVNPDLVILFAQKDGIAIADRFVAHGVAAIVILPEKLDSLYAGLRLIAGAVGVPQKAEKAISACQRVIDLTAERVATIPDKARKVVYFASPMGLFSTASGEMLQDEMIRMAGAIHAGHDLKGYFREISPEQFIAWNPDVVISSNRMEKRIREILGEPQFARVKAVADDRIYRFPSNIAPWDFPSPLSVLGVLWIAKTCYSESLADVDLQAEIERLHETLFGKGFEALGGRLSQ